MTYPKLFIPGPVHVSDATYHAMCRPMIGHRSSDFKALHAGMQPRLRELFGTTRPVFLSTSSAWGVMEGAVRNLCHHKILNCMCGAFSDKWFDVSKRCGLDATPLQVPWGHPITAEAVREALSAGGFDAITLIHNETSCGLRNPLPEIAAVVREFPEVMFIVDCVSSFSTESIPMDELGIDVLLTGSQKALALPPGLALFAASQRAIDKARQTPNRGYYFDFAEFEKNAEGNMTPSTPCISLIYALDHKLGEIFAEGPANRYTRHARLNAMVHAWARERGFDFFAPEGFRSLSLTCLANNRDIDLPVCIKRLRNEHGFLIDGGYGKIKGKTFRISNMGDETDSSIAELLTALDAVGFAPTG
jgi:aspartate aminotransferase-like enzyme